MAGLGRKKTGGRVGLATKRKAVKNNQTALREAILESFVKVGGVEYLVTQAHLNPVAYLGLIKGVIPKEIAIKSEDINIVDVMADFANRLPV
jgi:hypothetical protein